MLRGVALSQHLLSYLGFSYLGRRVSLHSCSSKAQPLLLTLDEGYFFTATPPDLGRGVAPLSPPVPTQLLLFGLKKIGKTTRPFRDDLNQIPYDNTVEVRNRFKGLDLIDRVPDELWMEVCDIV